jgi:hypothetical protein
LVSEREISYLIPTRRRKEEQCNIAMAMLVPKSKQINYRAKDAALSSML